MRPLNKGFSITLPCGLKLYRKTEFGFSNLIQKNGIVISRKCNACKNILPIENFSIYRQIDYKYINSRCRDCIKIAWSDRYSETVRKKRRARGVKPRNYIESRITIIDGVECLKCIKCSKFPPLCDFPVDRKLGRIDRCVCKTCKRVEWNKYKKSSK